VSDSDYPWEVIPDPSGGYVIRFPDLPGCMSQVEGLYHVNGTAAEIRDLWLATAREAGMAIPTPGTRNMEIRLQGQKLRAIAAEVRDWRAAYVDSEAAIQNIERLVGG
jgi:predicted RNase H-like HicB family nuclease